MKPNKLTFNVDEWIYQPGIPSNCVKIESERLKKIEILADRFMEGKDIFKKGKVKRENFTTQEWQTFIRRLPTDIKPSQMKVLDKKLNFKDCGNAEIMSEWYVLAIHSSYRAARPSMQKFLTKVGRRKYLEPIYETLANSRHSGDLAWGRSVFEKAKGNYHFVSQSTIKEILYN